MVQVEGAKTEEARDMSPEERSPGICQPEENEQGRGRHDVLQRRSMLHESPIARRRQRTFGREAQSSERPKRNTAAEEMR